VELDANPAATQAVMVFSVKNGRAPQIAQVLNNLLQTSGLVTGRGGGMQRGGTQRGGTQRGGTQQQQQRGIQRGGRSDAGDLDMPFDPTHALAQLDDTELNGRPRTVTDVAPWGQFTDDETAELIQSAAELDGG